MDDMVQKSVFTLREAKAKFKHVAVLFSGGKDSTVALSLCREAFFNTIPFPVIHIDNGVDFPETYAFRDTLVRDWGAKLLIAKSKIKKDAISGFSCCGANKTEGLKKLMQKEKIDALVVSIRRDEHGIRAKERVFSPRDKKWRWDYKHQPVEVWDYTAINTAADHYRVHPLLHWREIDVWNYIFENNLPVNPLYFSRDKKRFRSIGCTRCSVAVNSNAGDVPSILRELGDTTISERAGRQQDKEAEATMERLRALGYM